MTARNNVDRLLKRQISLYKTHRDFNTGVKFLLGSVDSRGISKACMCSEHMARFKRLRNLADPLCLRDDSRRCARRVTQPQTLKTQRSTLKTQNSTLNTQNSKLKTQNSTLNTQNSALNTQHSTLNTQHSTLKNQHSTLNTQHSTLNTQHSTLNTQHSSLKQGGSIFTILPAKNML